jgi:general stress protein 26
MAILRILRKKPEKLSSKQSFVCTCLLFEGGIMEVCRKYLKLHQKIKDLPVAMLTIINRDECLHSFPMYTVQTECEGVIWFFADFNPQRTKEIEFHKCVNLSYSSIEKGIYVSITGKAEFVKDKEKMKELWKPKFEVWFPGGQNDPDLSLLKINMEDASYWDETTGHMISLWDVTEAMAVTKEQHYF